MGRERPAAPRGVGRHRPRCRRTPAPRAWCRSRSPSCTPTAATPGSTRTRRSPRPAPTSTALVAEAQRRTSSSAATPSILRFGLFLGPDSDLTLGDIEAARTGISPSVGRRDAYRPTLWLDDAATAVAAALGAPAGIYNVADERPADARRDRRGARRRRRASTASAARSTRSRPSSSRWRARSASRAGGCARRPAGRRACAAAPTAGRLILRSGGSRHDRRSSASRGPARDCSGSPTASSAISARRRTSCRRHGCGSSVPGPESIDDLDAWLTTVVGRLALDTLRSARVRRERTSARGCPSRWCRSVGDDPADRVTLDESVSYALLALLEQLSPAERTAFVLHDVFDVPFAGDRRGRRAYARGGAPARLARASPRRAGQRPRFEASPARARARGARLRARASPTATSTAWSPCSTRTSCGRPTVVAVRSRRGVPISGRRPRGAARGSTMRRKGLIAPTATPIELNGRLGLLIGAGPTAAPRSPSRSTAAASRGSTSCATRTKLRRLGHGSEFGA